MQNAFEFFVAHHLRYVCGPANRSRDCRLRWESLLFIVFEATVMLWRGEEQSRDNSRKNSSQCIRFSPRDFELIPAFLHLTRAAPVKCSENPAQDPYQVVQTQQRDKSSCTVKVRHNESYHLGCDLAILDPPDSATAHSSDRQALRDLVPAALLHQFYPKKREVRRRVRRAAIFIAGSERCSRTATPAKTLNPKP